MHSWTRTPHSSEITTIQDVEVWTDQGVLQHRDIVLRDGRLVGINSSQGRRQGPRIAVMPSAVDTQVHMRTPGQWEKETPETACLAALRGGVGALLTMPNTKPTIDSVATLELAMAQIDSSQRRYGTRVLYSVAGTIGQKGEKLSPLADLAAAGATAVTDDGKGIADDGVQAEVFRAIEPLNLPFMQHAETLGARGPLADGPVPRRFNLKPYGPEHEIDMVARDLRLLEKYPKARYHLLHTSAAGSIPLLVAARAKGLRVTAEVSPHHLFFCVDDIDAENTSFKMNPPIRSASDREALIAALADGQIDWVATDHAPHEYETKIKPWSEATFGTLGLETMVPVVLDLVAKGRLSPARAVQVLSTKPAEFLGIAGEFGHLQLGKPARLILVRPDARWTVHASDHSSLSKNTCFDGIALTGQVVGHVNASGIWSDGIGSAGR